MTELKSNLTRRTFVGGAAAFGFTSLAVPHMAFADDDDNLTSAEVQAQADEVRAKLDDIQDRINQASNDYYTALEDYNDATAKMDECQEVIDENDAKISDLQGELSDRARDMYRDGQITFLDVLVGSSSFDDFLKNWEALQTINDADADLVAQTKALREENEEQQAEYESQAQTAQQKMDEATSIKNEAEELVAQYQEELDSLDEQVAELVEQEQQAAAEAAAAKAQAEFEAQQESSDSSDSSSSSESNSNSSSSSNSSNSSSSSSESSSSSSSSGSSSGDSSSSSSPSSSSGSGTPNTAALSVAKSCLGVPYEWGGASMSGFDCSGLTMYCYAATGYSIPHNSEAQYASANFVLSLSQAKPGDVLYTSGHVGICASSGGGSYIHAPTWGGVVCYGSYSLFYCALRW